jgi:hypothetical protein
MTTDKLTDDELMFSSFCYFCGGVITRTYVGVVFDANHDNGNPRPQILNEDGITQHLCAARQAVKSSSSYYYKQDFNTSENRSVNS